MMVLSVDFPTELVLSVLVASEGRIVNNILTGNLFNRLKQGLLRAGQIVYVEELLSSRGILSRASLLSLLVFKAAPACRALLK